MREAVEVREPDLHERPDLVLDPRLAREGEGVLVALPGLLRGDALLQAVVARDEELLNLLTWRAGHDESVALALRG